VTWEIFLGIVALVGFLISIGGIIFKLSRVLTSLEATVNSLKETLDDSKDDRKGMHKKLDNHETRLTKLEIKVDGSEN
jgi:septal ring factor EnvC (AmiA/AmiB activator)